MALILEKWKARNCSKYGFERGVSSGVGGIVGRKWRDLECDALRSRGRRDQRYHPSSLGELPRSSESPFYVTFCLSWKLCQVNVRFSRELYCYLRSRKDQPCFPSCLGELPMNSESPSLCDFFAASKKLWYVLTSSEGGWCFEISSLVSSKRAKNE